MIKIFTEGEMSEFWKLFFIAFALSLALCIPFLIALVLLV